MIIDDRTPCDNCRIVLTYELTVGDDDGPGLLDAGIVFVRDRRGRFYAVNGFESSAVVIFDRQGRYLSQVGREGDGPGEFRWIMGIVDDGGHLVILDGRARRQTVLGPDYQVLATRPIPLRPYQGGYIGLGDGRILFNGVIPTPEAYGKPFHLVDGQGALERSFGQPEGSISPLNERLMLQRPMGVVDETLLAGYSGSYRLEQWSLNGGTRIRTLVRQSDWFPSNAEQRPLSFEDPPSPIFGALHPSEADLVWTLSVRADDNWRAGLGRGSGVDGAFVSVERPEQAFDAMIELINWKEAVLIASGRFDPAVSGFLDAQHVYAVRKEQTGAVKYDVYHLHLSRLP
jgi:hypothetical protein